MTRGPKKHLKRLNAPKHWMLNKLGGIFVSSWPKLLRRADMYTCCADTFGSAGPQAFTWTPQDPRVHAAYDPSQE